MHDALSDLTFETAKHDSPRRPTRPTELLHAPATKDKAVTSTGHTVSALPPSTRRQVPNRHPLQPHHNSALFSKMLSDEPKSASILKLVGNGADKMGKSKDELVDEYKRARRAELEAMLRIMVQR